MVLCCRTNYERFAGPAEKDDTQMYFNSLSTGHELYFLSQIAEISKEK